MIKTDSLAPRRPVDLGRRRRKRRLVEITLWKKSILPGNNGQDLVSYDAGIITPAAAPPLWRNGS